MYYTELPTNDTNRDVGTTRVTTGIHRKDQTIHLLTYVFIIDELLDRTLNAAIWETLKISDKRLVYRPRSYFAD